MRIVNGCFIVLFMAMLTLPLVFVDLSSDRVSVEENRMLAERPKLADIKKITPGTFVHDFDAWFKDSTGFRKQLVKLYNGISKDTWWNGVLYKDGIYLNLVGEEGHHYFADVGGRLIPVFQGKKKILSDEQLANIAHKLNEVKTYLDSKGIPLIVMFCTMKESVYPEFLPKSIKRGGAMQLDVITEYLQEHTSVDVFNIRQALVAEKSNYLLYNVSSGDFGHYNEIGAFFAYRELMKHINIHFPQMVPYELKDIDINYDEQETSIVSLKTGKVYQQLDFSFFDNVNFDNNSPVFTAVFENADTNLPVILLISDSFAGEKFIGKYIAQHFGKTITVHFLNIRYLEEYIARFKPDIVALEAAELSLNMFADSVAKIPKLP